MLQHVRGLDLLLHLRGRGAQTVHGALHGAVPHGRHRRRLHLQRLHHQARRPSHALDLHRRGADLPDRLRPDVPAGQGGTVPAAGTAERQSGQNLLPGVLQPELLPLVLPRDGLQRRLDRLPHHVQSALFQKRTRALSGTIRQHHERQRGDLLLSADPDGLPGGLAPSAADLYRRRNAGDRRQSLRLLLRAGLHHVFHRRNPDRNRICDPECQQTADVRVAAAGRQLRPVFLGQRDGGLGIPDLRELRRRGLHRLSGLPVHLHLGPAVHHARADRAAQGLPLLEPQRRPPGLRRPPVQNRPAVD